MNNFIKIEFIIFILFLIYLIYFYLSKKLVNFSIVLVEPSKWNVKWKSMYRTENNIYIRSDSLLVPIINYLAKAKKPQ